MRSTLEEAVKVMMRDLKRMVLGAAMVLIVAFGAFAQDKKGGQKPPPKENPPPKVRVEDKKPPSNNGQGNQNRGGDKGGKP